MAATTDAAAAAALVAELNHIVTVAQIYVASTSSVLVWDWLSCIPQEWRYIWKANWSPTKVLYIFVRYYTLLVLVVTDVWFFASWSEQSCSKYLRVLPGVAVVIDLAIEMVLALRVWVLYGRSRRVGAFLCILLAGFLGVVIAVPILAFDYTRLPSWPGPCLVTGKASSAGPKFIIAFYASPMAVDFVLTVMTLHRAVYQFRGSSSSLLRTFIRDGLFYFIAISSLNLLNVIFFVQPNTLIQSINAPMSIQLSSVLCSRLILNLRAEGARAKSIKQFSNTRGRWVTDHVSAETTGGIALDCRSDVHSGLTKSASQRQTNKGDADDLHPSAVSNGIVVSWEQQVDYDALDDKFDHAKPATRRNANPV